jgi:arabinose-5-phosphate isomerase
LVEVTHKGLGMTAVADADNKMLGIFTDGDLRRVLDAAIDIHHTQVGAVMTRNCKTGRANMLAAEGLKLMQEHKINALLIVDDDDHLVGALNMHDLLLAGVL